MNKTYAGIGSRETPTDVLELMQDVAQFLASKGFTLRSGGAGGADSAFEEGCDKAEGSKEIYLPWKGFNNNKSTLCTVSNSALKLAEHFHPAWNRCSQGAQKLHARNLYQILGKDLNDKVDFVVCYTVGGLGGGGTGQAIRVAKYYNSPVYDLGKNEVRKNIFNLIGEYV